MSKWIDKELFDNFREKKKKEEDNITNGNSFLDKLWRPEKGTETKPKVFEFRWLPNPDENSYPYLDFYYHYLKSEEGGGRYITCPKSYDMKNYCPLCSVALKLYKGTKNDKKLAREVSRNRRYCANIYIVSDPRDADKDDADKVANTVKIWEFPGKVEGILKSEIVDKENGLGEKVFDPGKDGHNFILKVFSTRPDGTGQSWPDYNTGSKFSPNPKPIADTEDEIEEIMNQRYSLTEHLKNTNPIDYDMVKDYLKELMIFKLVENEWKKFIDPEVEEHDNYDRNGFNVLTEDDVDEVLANKKMGEEEEVETPNKEENGESSSEEEVDELLAELDKL